MTVKGLGQGLPPIGRNHQTQLNDRGSHPITVVPNGNARSGSLLRQDRGHENGGDRPRRRTPLPAINPTVRTRCQMRK